MGVFWGREDYYYAASTVGKLDQHDATMLFISVEGSVEEERVEKACSHNFLQ